MNNQNYKTNSKAELFKQIWKILEELRGKVDGWDFKGYVLGFLFYRYISENITKYINENEPDDNFDYSKLEDNKITEKIRKELINEKGFFIYPSQLFKNVLHKANQDIENLNEILDKLFKDIEHSALGTPSEENLKGIFGGIEINSDKLGKIVIDRNKKLLNIMKHIQDLNLGSFENKDIDIFGDAYEFMMAQYASNAGKSGGEYFTPQEVSKLLTKLAIGNKKEIKNVYDPACGSGSLLLQAEKILGNENIKDGFYGQESNITTYNLCRMNMFLHNINFDKFNIKHEDTLINPLIDLDKKFELVVSNPPYSISWEGENDPILINDPRFSPPGVLAPKSKADYAFILDALHHLDTNGQAAIVCFPGIFYRGGAELKIRKWLVENNHIAGLIALAPNLFYGTSINTVIMVLSKSKIDSKIMMIDASNLFEKGTNQNKLSKSNINQIVDTFLNKKEIEHFSKNVDLDKIKSNNFDLSISKYVEPKVIEEVININQLNNEIEQTTKRIDQLRKEIDLITKELESE